jgi:hypothetical protein
MSHSETQTEISLPDRSCRVPFGVRVIGNLDNLSNFSRQGVLTNHFGVSGHQSSQTTASHRKGYRGYQGYRLLS